MIVVADGDIVLNDVMPGAEPEGLSRLPMGWNKYTYTEYQKQSEYGRLFIPVANREFLLNCIEYLVNNPAISRNPEQRHCSSPTGYKKGRGQQSHLAIHQYWFTSFVSNYCRVYLPAGKKKKICYVARRSIFYCRLCQ